MPNTVQSLNRVGFTTVAAPGTGTITVDAALTDYRTPVTAGAVNNGTYKMIIFSGSDWELSKGVYSSGGTSMTRVLIESSTGSLLNIAGVGTVYFLEDAADENGGRMLTEPQGRLTNSTGVPLLTSTVSAATTLYYTMYKGNRAIFPDKDGFGLVMREFSELSQLLSDNTKSPAAAAAWRAYDCWLWDDAGTLRCTRGPGWTDGGRTFTVTIASPGVFTLNSHGFFEGQPVVFTTSGALPTGLTAGTVYFITATSLATNTFTVAASAGGAVINTSGSQSGTHTATTYVQTRGTGAGTEEHDTTTYPGWTVNAQAITNGPAAGRGFYVGTILTNDSSLLDMFVGYNEGAGGAGNVVGIWNAFQQEDIISENVDNTNSWNYTTATWRMKDNSFANRIIVITGKTRPVRFFTSERTDNSTANADRNIAASFNSSTAVITPGATKRQVQATVGGNISRVGTLTLERVDQVFGMGWHGQLEHSSASGTSTWYGDAGSADTYLGTCITTLRA